MEKEEHTSKSKFLITFSDTIIPSTNLRQILFDTKNSNYLVNGSHEVYEYLHEFEHLIYIFEGFYQDGFLVIIYDIFDKRTKNRVESRDVFVIPIEWKLVKNSNNMRWTLDVSTEIHLKIFKLNIRKRMYEIPFLKNFIENSDYEELFIKIKRHDIEFTQDVLSRKLVGLYEKVNKFNFFK
jgi:hypothetical protein